MTRKHGVLSEILDQGLAWLRGNERSHRERPPLLQSWMDAAQRQCQGQQREERLKQRRRRSWQQITRPPIIK